MSVRSTTLTPSVQNIRIEDAGEVHQISLVQKDTHAGKHSTMMAFDNATVTEVNAGAQAYRIATGALEAKTQAAMLRDGLTARVGEIIVTHENNRRLSTNRGKDFVKNNDVWDVHRAHKDGSLTVRHHGHQGTLTLPAEYKANRGRGIEDQRVVPRSRIPS
ncbi:hypothetical protein [Arthrobacter sp. R4-81]